MQSSHTVPMMQNSGKATLAKQCWAAWKRLRRGRELAITFRSR